MFSFSVVVSLQAEDPLRVVQNISLHPELNGGGERIISQQALCALEVISVPPADHRLEDKRVSGTLSHPGESMHMTCLIISPSDAYWQKLTEMARFSQTD